ncbi:hypothetical protein SARC_13410, partial [Sphaeroforma arctica JP610]
LNGKDLHILMIHTGDKERGTSGGERSGRSYQRADKSQSCGRSNDGRGASKMACSSLLSSIELKCFFYDGNYYRVDCPMQDDREKRTPAGAVTD